MYEGQGVASAARNYAPEMAQKAYLGTLQDAQCVAGGPKEPQITRLCNRLGAAIAHAQQIEAALYGARDRLMGPCPENATEGRASTPVPGGSLNLMDVGFDALFQKFDNISRLLNDLGAAV